LGKEWLAKRRLARRNEMGFHRAARLTNKQHPMKNFRTRLLPVHLTAFVLVAATFGLRAGIYTQDFSGLSVGATRIGGGTVLTSTGPSQVAMVVDENNKRLQLTAYNVGSTLTAFKLPNLDSTRHIYAFRARWKSIVSAPFNSGADGFSFNFGPLKNVNALNGATESGLGVGLSFCVQTYADNSPGFHLRLNGSTLASTAYNPNTQWGSFNDTPHQFEACWDIHSGITVEVDGVEVIEDVETPGFTPTAGDIFVWAARTGGLTETVTLDDIEVRTWSSKELAGRYSGAADASGNYAEDTGVVSINVNRRGRFHGKLFHGGTIRRFAGAFQNFSNATVVLPPKNGKPETTFPLQISSDGRYITGIGSTAAGQIMTFVAAHCTVRGTYQQNLAGAYTITTDWGSPPVAASSEASPLVAAAASGIVRGSLTLKVSPTGTVRGTGYTPDGKVFRFTSLLSDVGYIWIQTPLYGGRGYTRHGLYPTFHGFAGPTFWVKPSGEGTIYPLGLTNNGGLIGYEFVPPRRGVPLSTNELWQLPVRRPYLPEYRQAAMLANERLTGENRVSFRISRSTGAVRGTFFDPYANTTRRARGVFLQRFETTPLSFPTWDASGVIDGYAVQGPF
jgi:hypothetical protein